MHIYFHQTAVQVRTVFTHILLFEALNHSLQLAHTMATADPADAFFALYRYIPSLPLAAVAVGCFAVLTIWHGIRLVRRRAFYLTPFVIGGLCKFIPASAPQTPIEETLY